MNTATLANPEADEDYTRVLLKLFDKSILKQAKYKQICDLLGDPSGKTLMDIGADNGVISYLLREQGGHWTSTDLSGETVLSIKKLVGDRVVQIDGGRSTFADNEFDTVVIIDFLEHIHNDAAFVEELKRIIKPGGELLINVPHAKRGSVIRAIRLAVGLSDEKHGHVRPGYTKESLAELLGDNFTIEKSSTYSRFFVELLDIAISLAVELLSGKGGSEKGLVVTGDDLDKYKKQFKMYSLIYPFLKSATYLDKLIFFTQGHSLIVKAKSLK